MLDESKLSSDQGPIFDFEKNYKNYLPKKYVDDTEEINNI